MELTAEQKERFKAMLEAFRCPYPEMCSSFPYSCVCSLLVGPGVDTLHWVRALADAPDFPCRDCA